MGNVHATEEVRIPFDAMTAETEEALCFLIDKTSHWFPKSQVRVYLKKKIIYAPAWILTKKGLI